ncbi:acyl carrier protein [Robertmurraya kyonggiensis]|uniref:Acyl carrier protein n=1 Tax=Robertmurraya kyonggiensis TaxID=1037680 RepID=A0A4U1DAD6_9BACI|nr:phosphopantetheine-binding protein [Robertmurraya kyonggiensis]TKC19108.1 acyl carrier protein [Robertmurraya kyonggiensis]
METIVGEIIEELLKTNVDLDEDLFSIGMDSLLVLHLIVTLEEKFNIDIPDEELNVDSLKTVKSICNLVSKHEYSNS